MKIGENPFGDFTFDSATVCQALRGGASRGAGAERAAQRGGDAPQQGLPVRRLLGSERRHPRRLVLAGRAPRFKVS